MRRIAWLESRGAHCAAISDIGDGDCARLAEDAAPKARLLAGCGASLDKLVCPPQVHGTHILRVDVADGGLPEADGLITTNRDIVLGISVADCVPVYLFQPDLGIAGLLHAGRAGTMGNICGEAISQIRTGWGGGAVAGLFAYIGPSAGPCCYQVSPELAQEFAAAGLPCKGRNLDLWQANTQQLAAAGVPLENISCAEHCTICMPGFHSYRAHSTVARNIALLML